MGEREAKRQRLDAVLVARGLDAIVLRDAANLAWYLGGARVHVVPGAPILEVTVGRDGETLRTSVIEAPRLAAEELGADAPAITALPWWEPLDAPAAGAAGSDLPRAGEADVAAELLAARAVLTPTELDRLRALCADRAAAAGAALRAASRDDSELGLAGAAARELYARGIEPIVMLVAGAVRLPHHRHPLPTAAPLGDRTMLVVCGRRHGLFSAVTRMRAFAPLGAGDRARYAALLEVEAAYLDATRPRARIGDVVAAGAAAYAEHGFAADEWHAHHQGGPMGYATRDYLAHSGSDAVVQADQAFAWNPSGGGFKVEDTIVATAGGPEMLSPDPEWPALEVAGRQRPDVLA